jgi:hypothetical protein
MIPTVNECKRFPWLRGYAHHDSRCYALENSKRATGWFLTRDEVVMRPNHGAAGSHRSFAPMSNLSQAGRHRSQKFPELASTDPWAHFDAST